MAYLWAQDEKRSWSASLLCEPRYPLTANGAKRDSGASGRSGGGGRGALPAPPALIRAVNAAGAECWVRVTEDDSGVRLNGQAPPPIRILADKDEISAPGAGRRFFSTERLARVEPFEGPTDLCCPRCKELIKPGSAVVRCPGCGVVHHQSDEFPCWTHVERCALCDYPTALDAGFRWTPQEL